MAGLVLDELVYKFADPEIRVKDAFGVAQQCILDTNLRVCHG